MILSDWQDKRIRWHNYATGSRFESEERSFGNMSRAIGLSADEVVLSYQNRPNADGSKSNSRLDIGFSSEWISGSFAKSITPDMYSLVPAPGSVQSFYVDLCYDENAKLKGIRSFSQTDGSDEIIHGSLTDQRDRLRLAFDFNDYQDVQGQNVNTINPLVIQIGSLYYVVQIGRIVLGGTYYIETYISDAYPSPVSEPILYICPDDLKLFSELFAIETEVDALIESAIAGFKLTMDKRYCSR